MRHLGRAPTRRARESAELLKRLHDVGLSIFEPDPIAALEQVGRNGLPGGEAEQRRAASAE